MPIGLPDAPTIARAALKAHAEQRLCAQQQPTIGTFYATDRHPGIGCAVGVALNKEQIAAFTKMGEETCAYSVASAVRFGYVAPIPGPEVDAIQELQALHDSWATSPTSGLRREAEEKFLEHANALAAGAA